METATANPSSATLSPEELEAIRATRIPMSVPRRKLEVPDLPGYHLHWFLDRNIPSALQAAYEFVRSEEVVVVQTGVATSKGLSGNADMGTQVRRVGGTAEGGGVEMLTLMKLRLEFWKDDQKKIEDRNASILEAIFRGERIITGQPDGETDVPTERTGNLQYVKGSQDAGASKPVLQRPTRKDRS